MPIDTPKAINKQKNKLAVGGQFTRIDVDIPEINDALYFINDNVSVTYNSQLYTALAFTLGPWTSDTGTLHTRTLSIGNADISQFLTPYIEANDGIIGATITITPYFSAHPTADLSSKAQALEVVGCVPSEQWIQFTLGAPSLLFRRVPAARYLPTSCRWLAQFKGTECGYDGTEESCDGLYTRCVELGNQTRFGAEVGLKPKTSKYV